MTSTSINIGINEDGRSSSRILKPPGGGYSNIFATDNTSVPEKLPQRPKNNQQNSPGMCAVMGIPDPNEIVSKTNEMIAAKSAETPTTPTNGASGDSKKSNDSSPTTEQQQSSEPVRKRIPPGGFSSGLW